MKRRTKIPPEILADVLATCRRRCCTCYALHQDDKEKKGQIAHLDHDPSNHDLDNLAFLCLAHHDDYDSQTSQSKGLSINEVKRYRTELSAFVAERMPPTDDEIVSRLTQAFDRPAFRTPFHREKFVASIPRSYCGDNKDAEYRKNTSRAATLLEDANSWHNASRSHRQPHSSVGSPSCEF